MEGTIRRSDFKHNLHLQKWIFFILLLLVISLMEGVVMSPFYTKGEPREAMVAQAMMESGNFVAPTVYGEEIAFKPPMLHWCIVAFSYLFGGEVTELSARMPSAIGFIVMLTTFFIFVANRMRFRQALLATTLLLTSFEFHRGAMTARVDMLLTTFMVLSLLALYKWDDEDQLHGLPWWIPALLSAGFLTKGPVGLVLPLLVFFVYLILLNKYPIKQTLLKLVVIGFVGTLVPALWYFAGYKQHGDFFLYQAFAENFMRFLHMAPKDLAYDLGHEMPFYMVFVFVIVGFIPWILLLFFSAPYKKYMHKRGFTGVKTIRSSLWNKLNGMPKMHLFSWVVITVVVIFYMFPSSKRSVYIMPVYPFVALLMSYHILNLAKNRRRSLLIFSLLLGIVGTLLIGACLWLRYATAEQISSLSFAKGKTLGEMMIIKESLTQHTLLMWMLTFILIVSVLAIIYQSRRKNYTKVIYCNVSLVFVINLIIDGPVMMGYKSYHSSQPFADAIRPMIAGKSDQLYVVNNLRDGYYNLYGVAFYLDERPKRLHNDVKEGLLLVWKRDLERLSQDYGDRYVFTLLKEGDHVLKEGRSDGVPQLYHFDQKKK